MGAESKIEWTDHTFSPWWGCTKVSPGCEHCYADSFSRRVGHGKRLPTIWGPRAERRFMSDAHWNEPLRWNRAAEKAGKRAKVFCASMADVFEDREDLVQPRRNLFRLIMDTPNLDWLLLTKRPENADRLWRAAWQVAAGLGVYDFAPRNPWLPNIWLGTTAEDQRRADERIPHLLATPSAVRFVSYEPALGPVDFFAYLETDLRDRSLAALGSRPMPGLDWVIVGGESGPGARTFDLAWMRSTIEQCRAAGTKVFCKQLGARPVVDGRGPERVDGLDGRWLRDGADALWAFDDAKGSDWSRWPHDLRVREWPRGAS